MGIAFVTRVTSLSFLSSRREYAGNEFAKSYTFYIWAVFPQHLSPPMYGGKTMDRIEVKTAENQLRQEFIQGYGYPPRIAEALVNTVTEHNDLS